MEISPRMSRDLISLSESRPGMIPVLGDARKSRVIAPFIRSKADWIHQDLSIADQAETFVKMAMNFLIPGCLLYTSPSPRDVEESRMPSSA